MGNEKANAYWEANLPDSRKPGPNDAEHAVESFIKEKYLRKTYVKKGEPPTFENWHKSHRRNNNRGGDQEKLNENSEDPKNEVDKDKDKSKKPSSKKKGKPAKQAPPEAGEPDLKRDQGQESSSEDLLQFAQPQAGPPSAQSEFELFSSVSSQMQPSVVTPIMPTAGPAPAIGIAPGVTKPNNDIMAMFDNSLPPQPPSSLGSKFVAPVYPPPPAVYPSPYMSPMYRYASDYAPYAPAAMGPSMGPMGPMGSMGSAQPRFVGHKKSPVDE
jgi:hypothetical protein